MESKNFIGISRNLLEEEDIKKHNKKGAGSRSFISKHGKGPTPQYQKRLSRAVFRPHGGV
jgi:hypothetical protein